jgi:hypothetical protein
VIEKKRGENLRRKEEHMERVRGERERECRRVSERRSVSGRLEGGRERERRRGKKCETQRE